MKKGDFIKINYTGKIKETDKVFDTTEEEVAKKEGLFKPDVKYGPTLIIVGHGKIVSGLDEEISKMKVGEKKIIEISPEMGFGKRDPNMLKLLSISEFKKQNIDPYPGMILNMDNLSCRIISVNSGRVRVDFNHPLAGKTLIYDLEIKESIEKDVEKIKAVCEYYDCESQEVKIEMKEVEIVLKNDVNERIKKMITDDIFDHMDFSKIKFSQFFERKK
ncbi:MAG: peptidylprolyl isomerase [Candidatus Aenigmarchaeota archaeon]|nr:peptidylprolyl isomerase [Candidatus Aenigmarchaeota archaeon]